jgi:hypothetical protein
MNTLTVAYLAEAHLLAAHVEDATEHVAHAVKLSRQRNERGHEAWAQRLVGEIASRHEPPDLSNAAASYRRPSRWRRSWACVPSSPIVILALASCACEREII